MCKLSYEEIILLDNFIYLDWDVQEETSVYELAKFILEDNRLKVLMDKMNNCTVSLTEKEWVFILKFIIGYDNFKNTIIKDVRNYKNGMRVACFEYLDEAIVVFRGTTTIKEWDDNGYGAYEYDTEQQISALKYIDDLKYNNVIVSGHSKGGNKAQYVSIRSSKVEKCISINGQGFSNEFIDKYSKPIEENKNKIIAINAKYDYVHCLLNPIAGETHHIKTVKQSNPLFYHKPNIILNRYGKLNEETKESKFVEIINEFSVSLISDLPENVKSMTIDGLMCAIENILCTNESVKNIDKIVFSFLVMFNYGKYFKDKMMLCFSYALVQILIIPILYWGNFIESEEVESKSKLIKVLNLVENDTNILVNNFKNYSYKMSLFSNNRIFSSVNKLIRQLKNIERCCL